MDPNIEQKFEKMGARISIGENPVPNVRRSDELENSSLTVDVLNDKKGQIFDIKYRGKVDLTVLDLKPDDRHLVLLAKLFDTNKPHQEPDKIKFLCGHDEREWFSSQLPSGGVTNVNTAKLSLAPNAVRRKQKRNKLKIKDRVKRKTAVSLRQGEWFFVPVDIPDPDMDIVLRNEPLMVSNTRGGSKPHMAQFAYRTGGTTVYIPQLPFMMAKEVSQTERERLGAGLTEREKKVYLREHPNSKQWSWTHQIRNPTLYVKGTIRHKDHATLKLRGWHQVHMNEEVRGRFNVFLD